MIENYSEIKSLLDKVFALLQEESVSSEQKIAALERRIAVLEQQLRQQSAQQSQQPQQPQPAEQPVEEPPFQLRDQMNNASEFPEINTIVEIEDSFWDDDDEQSDAEDVERGWMTDFPGEKVSDVRDAISFSERICFIRELFMDDDEQYEFTLDSINETSSFSEVVAQMRAAFEWDEDSSEVYRFYMAVRRRFQ